MYKAQLLFNQRKNHRKVGFEAYAFKYEQIPSSLLSTWQIPQGQESFPPLTYNLDAQVIAPWEHCLLVLHLDVLLEARLMPDDQLPKWDDCLLHLFPAQDLERGGVGMRESSPWSKMSG